MRPWRQRLLLWAGPFHRPTHLRGGSSVPLARPGIIAADPNKSVPFLDSDSWRGTLGRWLEFRPDSEKGLAMTISRRGFGLLSLLGAGALHPARAEIGDTILKDIEGLEDFIPAVEAYVYGYPLLYNLDEIGKVRRLRSTRAEEILGRSLRPASEALVATARTALAQGLA